MTLRALVFDVDGTLAETEEVHRRAFNETFAGAGLPWHWSHADYLRLLRTTGGKERMRRYRCERGDRLPTDDEIARLHAVKTRRYAEIVATGGLALRPGVAALIAAARAAELKIGVATTTSRPNVESLCRACWGCGAETVFDTVAAGDEVAEKKPAPDVYLLALERLGVGAGEAIALEDSRNGLVSARAAGLRTLVTPSRFTAGEAFDEADWIAPDLGAETLPPLLGRLVSGLDAMPGRRAAAGG